ncbi:uncharacterized protein MONBRDRAFT_35888 [Monosiga brevicollis MX1]|uniref:DUF924-domain-containing protein n=1 Tax=Monosiga brevicollis TaxID=81824 RepID=A9USF3_MONBE|nr:uncharacterized protein MONBRDRAFT_35888 [Monosiga brevicollis MX1]EDQ92092.1 predicted protein [Monosiga brevicollis MX1]|eukprot:XP_001743378.1 hypothetical protein [Monosiga brevicollis MX1]
MLRCALQRSFSLHRVTSRSMATYRDRAVAAGQDLPVAAAEVLDYWFGADKFFPLDQAALSDEPSASDIEARCRASFFFDGTSQFGRWFASNKVVDEEVRSRFGQCLEALETDDQALASWTASANPRGTIAAVLVADQMSRNAFRGTARSFAFDRLAVGWISDLVTSGAYRQLRPIECLIGMLPLEHSEDLDKHALHERIIREVCSQCRDALDQGAPEAEASLKAAEGFISYLKDHTEVLQRFGRYPHRNRVLGRESTPEELEYLKDGKSWGQ